MKKDSYIKGAGIKSISAAPDWVIKIIGWIDSYKSPDVASAHLNKYLANLASNEKDEALLAVAALRGYRTQGEKYLYTITHTDVGITPDIPSSDNSPVAQRAYSTALTKHKSKMATITSAKEALPEIDAAITSGNLVFEERLEKTRNKGKHQIDVYIKGVRSGKLHSFAPEITFDDTARSKYYAANKETDDLIHQYAKEGKI